MRFAPCLFDKPFVAVYTKSIGPRCRVPAKGASGLMFGQSISAVAALGALLSVSSVVHGQTPTPPAPTPTTNAKTAKPPTEDPEVKMGREAHEEMVRSGLKLIKDPALVARVETIGKKMAAIANANKFDATYGSSNVVPYDYKFFIVDDSDVNAFSLPGGYIYINKGLLNYCQSDDELAGVLGHEIIHAAHHHVAKLQHEQSRINQQMMMGALVTLVARVPAMDAMNLIQGFQLIALQKVNGFGQNAERDADRAGLVVVEKSGYNPVGMLTFMERLARDQQLKPDVELGIFRTHPPEHERAEALEKQIVAFGLPLNRRAVTTMLRVEVRKVLVGTVTASEVLLDKKVVYRTPSEERAQEAARRLDTALNDDIQLFDVTRQGNQIRVKNKPVITIEPGDTDLPSSPGVEVLTDTGYKNLRLALYRQSIENGL